MPKLLAGSEFKTSNSGPLLITVHDLDIIVPYNVSFQTNISNNFKLLDISDTDNTSIILPAGTILGIGSHVYNRPVIDLQKLQTLTLTQDSALVLVGAKIVFDQVKFSIDNIVCQAQKLQIEIYG